MIIPSVTFTARLYMRKVLKSMSTSPSLPRPFRKCPRELQSPLPLLGKKGQAKAMFASQMLPRKPKIPAQDESESDTENTANEEEQLSERYLLLVDQLSLEQNRHLSVKDLGIILERLSSKIVDVDRLERERESTDVHNWTIKATIREVLREIGVIYNGQYYGIMEHPGYF
ncbi:hypothetical protein CEXT_269291 [Caerostris extrusa]|uniref:Uncharacterized protein n=1 Tax=Caerostris extrusa TaxID=172846 RepID=A0AAV4XW33_CAEEX|nr:hypothetical protein CEXT_269291 [Caerostris extrusa]